MSVSLEIADGDPWWLSPNVWVVPGNDPEGPPGTPREGKPAYLWARVRNGGADGVENATVRFYWANPAVGFDRNTATRVGTAFVTLDSGQTADVLCLTPWTPSYVNQGHECILAEAFHNPLDPLPATPVFDVPSDRHVAQRNLGVVKAAAGGMFHHPFEVCNTWRTARTFTVRAEQAPIDRLKPLLPLMDRGFQIPPEGRAQDVGFVQSPCPDAAEYRKPPARLERLDVAPHACIGYSLVGTLEGEAALIHVIQESEGQPVGGLSVLVLRPQEKKR